MGRNILLLSSRLLPITMNGCPQFFQPSYEMLDSYYVASLMENLSLENSGIKLFRYEFFYHKQKCHPSLDMGNMLHMSAARLMCEYVKFGHRFTA